ncbi:MAG: hypothetical protein OEN56_07465 [Gemmatimonadota bacterium]|nr:hypothetical protein [Gemmatimonadota bacterium]
MSRSSRRRHGLVLLALFVAQATAAPVGACTQSHEGPDGLAHDTGLAGQMPAASMAAVSHHGGATMLEHAPDGIEHAPDGMPIGCLALATCGAPAIGAADLSSGIVLSSSLERKELRALDRPATIVMRLVTPPPKI